jgi:hypothetical protein
MRLAVAAWRVRGAAREALRMGDLDRAAELAGRAQQLCATTTGHDLEVLVVATRAATLGIGR